MPVTEFRNVSVGGVPEILKPACTNVLAAKLKMMVPVDCAKLPLLQFSTFVKLYGPERSGTAVGSAAYVTVAKQESAAAAKIRLRIKEHHPDTGAPSHR